jgi:GNAT superfamily N-acetyltransferase
MCPGNGGCNNITITLLKDPDIRETTTFYRDIFLKDEPMTRIHGIDPGIFFQHALVYTALCARDDLSFIARNCVTGDFAGFVLCSDLCTDWLVRDPRMAGLFSLFHESTCILEFLEEHYRKNYPCGTGKSLHLFQVGITPRFRGQGIAQSLIRTAVEHAYRRGFTHAFAECTWSASRELLLRCGFSGVYRIRYREFCTNGAYFFKDLPGEITLMVRELTDKQTF